MNTIYEEVIQLLNEEGVKIEDLALIAYDLQKPYISDITLQDAIDCVASVLIKREVVFAVMVAIELDRSAREKRMQNKTLQEALENDEGLFGVDEVLAYSICNIYGSIALTNFGYIDKTKPGIVGVLNDNHERCNVFLDDICGAIAASAASRFAHRYKK